MKITNTHHRRVSAPVTRHAVSVVLDRLSYAADELAAALREHLVRECGAAEVWLKLPPDVKVHALPDGRSEIVLSVLSAAHGEQEFDRMVEEEESR